MNFAAVIFISEIGFFQLSVRPLAPPAVRQKKGGTIPSIGDAKGGTETRRDERNAAEGRDETTGQPVKERRENESESPDRSIRLVGKKNPRSRRIDICGLQSRGKAARR